MPHLYIDSDACPVKEEAVRVATRHQLQVTMVSNQGMRPLGPNVRNVMVGPEFDAADNWIVEHATEGDIVVTSDIQLAGRCLKKNCKVLGPTGHVFTTANIGTALAMRELNSHLRETGEIKGHNAPFSKKDRSQFLQSLELLITRN